MPKKIWVVVADAARADIFTADRVKGSLQLKESHSHPAGRLKEQELISDAAGRSFDSVGKGRHFMEVKTTAKKQELIRFAKAISRRIESARKAGEFDELVIISGPEFLGELRQALSAPAQAMVVQEIDKNLAGRSANEVAQHLHDWLESA